MSILAEGGRDMNEGKSWLSNCYSGCHYESDVDNDMAQARRRKAIAELRGLIREKHIEQIDKAIKGI